MTTLTQPQLWMVRNVSSFGLAVLAGWLMAGTFDAANAQLQLDAKPPAIQTFKVLGQVLKASGKHDVHVMLWRNEGFLEKPAQQIRIKAGQKLDFRFDVPAGNWAVSAFEDTNDNGVLDMGSFGPNEPSGFWRAFKGWRKPKFEDVSSPVTQDTSTADITLK